MDHLLGNMDADISNIERGVPLMAYLEKIPVQLVETQPMNILSIRATINMDQYGMYMGKLFERMAADKLTPLGGPFCIYHCKEFNPEAADIEFAIPVKEVVKGTRELPGGLCAKSTLKGPYPGLTSVYARLEEWLETEGYALTNAPYEVYVNDPKEIVPDELITDVYYPVKKL